MKLLVTGGLGFIGSNFIRHVLAEGKYAKVVNLDLQTYAGNPANLADVASDKRYRYVKGDIADRALVDKVMTEFDFDFVANFAAETHVDRSILDAAAFLRTNVIGTQVLLDAALKHHVSRFLHVSTDEVYGSIPKGFSKEGDNLEPNSPYAASKAASDLLVRAYAVTHKLPVLITRASNNFGPCQFPEKALPLMITNWINNLPFPRYGDGKQVRDWLYVLDHARAIQFLLEKGKTGEIYNIGGSEHCPNNELIEKARGLMKKPKDLVVEVPDRPGHDRRYALNCDKLKKLGFKHAFKFDEALKETIAWYQRNEDWWRPLRTNASYQTYYIQQYQDRLKAAAAR
jgi:dTDP-glucose 4,6-dehydratase